MGRVHPLNMRGYHNTGCFNCRFRELTLVPVCANNYSNVYRSAKVYCKKKKELVSYPHERCKQKQSNEFNHILGDYSHV